MSRLVCTVALLMLVSAACTPPASHPPAVPPTATASAILSDQALTADLGAYMEQQAANLSFSGAVLVARRGKVFLQNGYGAADRRWKRPNTEQTRFRIASISKQFTAVAILLLQSRGKLNVHDRVCTYLPDCPPAWEAVTLHQLLTHTSGIPNYTVQPDYASYRATPAASSEVMARFSDLPLEFAPGDRFAYSNSGYLVLGLVIERLSALPYEQFLQQNIFTPLGLKNTGCLDGTGLALGYANSYDRTQADHSDPMAECADGGLYSTVGDLYLWDQALLDDSFLSADLRELAFTAYEFMPESGGLSYGYGFMVGELPELYGHPLVGHTGRIEGFLTANFYFPDEQVAVILLANQRNPSLISIFTQLASKVLEPAS